MVRYFRGFPVSTDIDVNYYNTNNIPFADIGSRGIFLRNVTPEQGREAGAIVSGTLQNSGLAKRAVIPNSEAEAERYLSPELNTPDNYAAVGAALNMGSEALFNLEAEGFTIINPDLTTLEERGVNLSDAFKEKIRTQIPTPYHENIQIFTPNEIKEIETQNTPNNNSDGVGTFLLIAAGAALLLGGKK